MALHFELELNCPRRFREAHLEKGCHFGARVVDAHFFKVALLVLKPNAIDGDCNSVLASRTEMCGCVWKTGLMANLRLR